MVAAKWRIQISGDGQIALPAEFMRRYHLESGDEVAVEDTGFGIVISAPLEDEALNPRDKLYLHPTPDELARRKIAVDRVLELRAMTPSIAPYTTADLVHMSRDDNFWYGEEESSSNGTGA